MPVTVKCQACGAKYAAEERLAGRTVACPNCGGAVVVPMYHAPAKPSADDPYADLLNTPPTAPRGPARPPELPPPSLGMDLPVVEEPVVVAPRVDIRRYVHWWSIGLVLALLFWILGAASRDLRLYLGLAVAGTLALMTLGVMFLGLVSSSAGRTLFNLLGIVSIFAGGRGTFVWGEGWEGTNFGAILRFMGVVLLAGLGLLPTGAVGEVSSAVEEWARSKPPAKGEKKPDAPEPVDYDLAADSPEESNATPGAPTKLTAPAAVEPRPQASAWRAAPTPRDPARRPALPMPMPTPAGAVPANVRPAPQPTAAEPVAAATAVNRYFVGKAEWDLPDGWEVAQVTNTKNPMGETCAITLRHKTPDHTSWAGVAFGCEVGGTDDPAYVLFRQEHLDRLNQGVKETPDHKGTQTLRQTLGDVEFERITAYFDDSMKASLFLGVQNGRAVAYWFVGHGGPLSHIWNRIGKAKPLPN